jgi:hypothetical protein
MIGAIVLTHRQRGDVRGQKPSSQIAPSGRGDHQSSAGSREGVTL